MASAGPLPLQEGSIVTDSSVKENLLVDLSFKESHLYVS
jgi:hypothetical protein